VPIHLAPQPAAAPAFSSAESAALISILRSVAREPRIGSYSVAAFNLDQTEIHFRRRDASEIDFPALGGAIRNLSLGAIEVRELLEMEPKVRFMGRLLTEELAGDSPDGLIFVGPKSTTDSLT
jgi:hypothetical protein